jgi:uncharacterized CHY-type Zn-finger protein
MDFVQRFPLMELPADVLAKVMMDLNLFSLHSMMLGCHELHDIAQHGSIWKTMTRTQLGITYIHYKEKPDLDLFPNWKTVFKSVYSQRLILPSFQDEEKTIMGCQHYRRRVMLRAQCCHKFFACRLCHDEKESHKIDRFKTQTMLCMVCKTVQAAAKNCANCYTEAARYYCDICKLWTDDPEKPIYHCNKCGLCRVGRGLGEDNWHCDKCDICLSINVKDTHTCTVKKGLKTVCPVCRREEFVFYSRDPIVLLRCGHGIHYRCFTDLMVRQDQRCSLCLEEQGISPDQPNPVRTEPHVHDDDDDDLHAHNREYDILDDDDDDDDDEDDFMDVDSRGEFASFSEDEEVYDTEGTTPPEQPVAPQVIERIGPFDDDAHMENTSDQEGDDDADIDA